MASGHTSEDPFAVRWRRKHELRGELVMLRRQELGLSHEELAARVRPRRLRPRDLEAIERGEGSGLHENDIAPLETSLGLPAGCLEAHLWACLTAAAAPEAVTALEVREAATAAETVSGVGDVIGCRQCYRTLGWLVRYYGLEISVGRTETGPCVCEGEASAWGNNTAVLFRLAVHLSGAQRVLVLGGGQELENIVGKLRFAEVSVIRGSAPGSHPRTAVRSANLVILAGEIGHSASAPYLNALEATPEASRPRLVRPRSSSVAAIAEEILESYGFRR